MNYMRTLAAMLACCAALCVQRSSAQVAAQRIGLDLTIHYQTDLFVTNVAAMATNEASLIRPAYVDANDVIRAIRLDWGPNVTNWYGSTLLREVNLATGAEGIFLRLNGKQTNVSSYFTNIFGPSYSNDFKSQVLDWFPAMTNDFTVPLPLERGVVRFRPAGATTNYTLSEDFFFSSFNSTNIKFNLVGFGVVTPAVVTGRLNGVFYSNVVDEFNATMLGTLQHNLGTNLQNKPGVPSDFAGGTAIGFFGVGKPVYLAITNGP